VFDVEASAYACVGVLDEEYYAERECETYKCGGEEYMCFGWSRGYACRPGTVDYARVVGCECL